MEVKYSNFKVQIDKPIDEEITIHNFYKRDLWIAFPDNWSISISRNEVNMYQVTALLSGNEEECKRGIRSIIDSRKFDLQKLEKYANN